MLTCILDNNLYYVKFEQQRYGDFQFHINNLKKYFNLELKEFFDIIEEYNLQLVRYETKYRGQRYIIVSEDETIIQNIVDKMNSLAIVKYFK